MSVEVILQTTGTLISLAGEIQNSFGSGQPAKGSHDRVVQSLRQIYFTPTGSLSLLAVLAEGETPTAEMCERVLPRFNDVEFRVDQALNEIEDLFEDRNISLRAATILREIAYGKRRIRREIQELVNEALTYGHRVDPQDAKAVLAAVKALNSAIESVEAAYNWRVGRL
jgi:hypothetical protein